MHVCNGAVALPQGLYHLVRIQDVAAVGVVPVDHQDGQAWLQRRPAVGEEAQAGGHSVAEASVHGWRDWLEARGCAAEDRQKAAAGQGRARVEQVRGAGVLVLMQHADGSTAAACRALVAAASAGEPPRGTTPSLLTRVRCTMGARGSRARCPRRRAARARRLP